MYINRWEDEKIKLWTFTMGLYDNDDAVRAAQYEISSKSKKKIQYGAWTKKLEDVQHASHFFNLFSFIFAISLGLIWFSPHYISPSYSVILPAVLYVSMCM